MNAIGAGVPAYPLSWPVGWPRSPKPKMDRFAWNLTVAGARNEVYDELRLLGARDVVISSNAELNRDGRLSSRQRHIEDPGVAVYFTLKGEQRCIPCDRWDRLQANLHAIALSIGALRGLDRWGASEMVSAAFRGFAALPAGTVDASFEPWWERLEVAPDATREEIDAAYRRLAKQYHPDFGEDPELFLEIKEAWEEGKRARPT